MRQPWVAPESRGRGRTLDLLWGRRGDVCFPGLPGSTSGSSFVPFICPHPPVWGHCLCLPGCPSPWLLHPQPSALLDQWGGGASHCWIWAENLSAFVIQVSHRDEAS